MNSRCIECGSATTYDHHVVPRSLGGTFTVPLCAYHHGLVHNKKAVDTKTLTQKALLLKKAKGEKTGGTVPYGFDVDAQGRLSPNEGEQDALKAIVDLHGRGWSLRAICAEMEARGIKTKTGKTTWQPKVISRLLKVAA